MKAILIDVDARDIREVSYETLQDLQAFVGGQIEMAFSWPDGHTLYVNEEGLFIFDRYFWFRHRLDQPLAGNGIVVGRELDEEGQEGQTIDPELTVEQVRSMVMKWI